jgi:hypothetical protein
MKASIGIKALLLSLSLSGSSFGQVITGIVMKANTKEVLPFVSIGVQNSSKATSTDLTGSFSISVMETDTLLFSSVGFKMLKLPVSQINSTVFLEESVTILKEVGVKGKKRLRSTVIGNIRGRNHFSAKGPNQYAKFLKNELNADGILEELIFYVDPAYIKDDRANATINIRVYANQNGLPGEDLLTENLILSLKRNTNRFSVDISKYTIPFPQNGLFIGFDFIGYFENDNFVPYSRNNRPNGLLVEFVQADKCDTYRRFFGSRWMIINPLRGNQKEVGAKFGARISY